MHDGSDDEQYGGSGLGGNYAEGGCDIDGFMAMTVVIMKWMGSMVTVAVVD